MGRDLFWDRALGDRALEARPGRLEEREGKTGTKQPDMEKVRNCLLKVADAWRESIKIS
jgi:hypothetical protein